MDAPAAKPANAPSPAHPSTQAVDAGASAGVDVQGEKKAPRKVSSAQERFAQRVAKFQAALKPDGGKLDLSALQKLSFQGIPEDGAKGLRAVYWKVLLNYLPLDCGEWDDALVAKRKLYQEFLDELIIDPHAQEKDKQEEQLSSGLKGVDLTAADHPLNPAPASTWGAFFKDAAVQSEIDKDVTRTLPDMHFFNHTPTKGTTLHYEAIRRILFVYAKLNPGIKYVQGMNEILAPIYYVFATDIDETNKTHAEADAFFCFTNLMSEIRDRFIAPLDNSDVGVEACMKQLNDLLQRKDFDLWAHLERLGIAPQFYSFRWLTLLLSQEFLLPDVLRLWDTLFGDPRRFEFLHYVCVAMITSVRATLLAADFATALKLLQSYPSSDINMLLGVAFKLRAVDYGKKEPYGVRP